MGLILRNCSMFHIPKTGGKMVRFALACSGIPFIITKTNKSGGPVKEIMGAESSHGIPDEKEFQERPKIAFVRHPATWLQSYWSFREYSAEPNYQWTYFKFDQRCRADNFPEFIDNYLALYPGFVTELFRYYTQHCQWVGKQERLLAHLQSMMLQVEDMVIDCPAMLVNPSDKREAKYGAGQLKAVVKVERGIIDEFDYPCSIDDLADVKI